MSRTETLEVPKRTQKIDNVSNVTTSVRTLDITNHAGIELVVLDAYLVDPSATDELYQQSLNILLTTDGENSIKAGTTKTIVVGEAHTDANGNAVDYTLIIARADNLFPVKLLELAVSASTSVFPAATVTAEDAKLMKGAEAFQQAITAFPSSQMATAFATVLPANDEKQVAAFFKVYPQYGAITLDEVVAIQTYYNRYGFVWAGYAATQTFDVYTSPDGTTKKNLGSVSITNNVISSITNVNALAGFTATYMDANHRKTPLTYANGQFSEDAANTVPNICVQGLFVLLSQLSGEATDNRIVPVLYGVINGAKVFGVSSNYPAKSVTGAGLMNVKSETDNVVTADIKDYFDSLGLYGWLKLGGIVLGAIAGLVVLCVTVRYIFKRVKRSLLTPEEIRSLNQQKASKILERMADAGVKIPDNLTGSLADIKAQADANLLMDNKVKLERILQKQYNETIKMMEYGNTDALRNTFDSLDMDRSIISTITDPSDMATHIDSMRQNIGKNAKVLADRGSAISKKISTADAKMISDAKEVADSFTRAVDTNEKIREELLEDEFPEIIED